VLARLATSGGLTLDVAPASPEDEDELFAAFSAVVEAGEGYPQSPPVSRDEFREYWLDHKSLVAVARAADAPRTLVGSYYLKANFPGRAAHIANAGYVVVPTFRGRGAGRALVEHSMEEGRRLGFDALQFNLVFESNPARRMYERLGFEVVGRIPAAVDGENAIVYWRSLT
jgi:ribosomal protein S18 acetylase RimI-like enzyme